MLSPKTRWIVLRAVIVGEAALFLGSFSVWHKMNRNRDYRKWMHEKYPSVLEGFYRAAELGGYVDIRKDDYVAWSK